MDAHEVPTDATDHLEALLVGPLVQDLLAHLAQLGGLGSCEQHRHFRSLLEPGELAVLRSHLSRLGSGVKARFRAVAGDSDRHTQPDRRAREQDAVNGTDTQADRRYT